jgi:tetratricopeptide (TPR) repeat protein
MNPVLFGALVLGLGALGGESTEARRAYESGLASFATRTESGLSDGLRLFESAASLDPTFAAAHAGIADASCLLALYGYRAPSEVMPRAGKAATEAIRLDPSLAKAHAPLGLERYLYEWKFEDARSSFERASALDPDYAPAHHWYAMMLMATGHGPESLREIDRALALEPSSVLYQVKRGTILMASGKLDEAQAHLQGVAERFPRSPLPERELGLLELARGRPDEALPRLERAVELSEGADRIEATYGLVLGLTGNKEKARTMLAALRRSESSSAGNGYVSPIAYALLHVGLGEPDRALDELERAFALRDSALVYIRTQPGLASLRGERRFEKLVQRMGLFEVNP